MSEGSSWVSAWWHCTQFASAMARLRGLMRIGSGWFLNVKAQEWKKPLSAFDTHFMIGPFGTWQLLHVEKAWCELFTQESNWSRMM